MCSINLESCRLFNIPRRKPPTPLPPPLSRGAEDWLAYSSPRITLLHSKTFLLVSRHKFIIIFQWWKKFSSPVTPILETKGHKTLLKELFMYYVSAEWGEGGAHSNWVWMKEWRRFDHDDHTLVAHLLDHLGSRALQSSCPQQCQPGWENRKPKSRRWCVAFLKTRIQNVSAVEWVCIEVWAYTHATPRPAASDKEAK